MRYFLNGLGVYLIGAGLITAVRWFSESLGGGEVTIAVFVVVVLYVGLGIAVLAAARRTPPLGPRTPRDFALALLGFFIIPAVFFGIFFGITWLFKIGVSSEQDPLGRLGGLFLSMTNCDDDAHDANDNGGRGSPEGPFHIPVCGPRDKGRLGRLSDPAGRNVSKA